MRTAVDLDDTQIQTLDELSKKDKQSRVMQFDDYLARR